jgi:hypothetical protein
MKKVFLPLAMAAIIGNGISSAGRDYGLRRFRYRTRSRGMKGGGHGLPRFE